MLTTKSLIHKSHPNTNSTYAEQSVQDTLVNHQPSHLAVHLVQTLNYNNMQTASQLKLQVPGAVTHKQTNQCCPLSG